MDELAVEPYCPAFQFRVAYLAEAFGLAQHDIVLSIHCGSRGLGHQIGTDFLPKMVKTAQSQGIELPEKELACAAINSEVGQKYLGAMNCGINCAVANRQVLTHLVRQVFDKFLPRANLVLLYDVSHNTCKVEEHTVDGRSRRLYVHRKGATRAFGPGNPELPSRYQETGQPVIIPGDMGTASYLLVGTKKAEEETFSSTCHGAGRLKSRHEALKTVNFDELIKELVSKDKLKLVFAPCREGCSGLLKSAARGRIAYIDDYRTELEKT